MGFEEFSVDVSLFVPFCAVLHMGLMPKLELFSSPLGLTSFPGPSNLSRQAVGLKKI